MLYPLCGILNNIHNCRPLNEYMITSKQVYDHFSYNLIKNYKNMQVIKKKIIETYGVCQVEKSLLKLRASEHHGRAFWQI